MCCVSYYVSFPCDQVLVSSLIYKEVGAIQSQFYILCCFRCMFSSSLSIYMHYTHEKRWSYKVSYFLLKKPLTPLSSNFHRHKLSLKSYMCFRSSPWYHGRSKYPFRDLFSLIQKRLHATFGLLRTVTFSHLRHPQCSWDKFQRVVHTTEVNAVL